ncbi:MAG: response regulator, partial [Oscillospiraceae bacterium]|nr:response regulator [Oscillospiraceae bacterium]
MITIVLSDDSVLVLNQLNMLLSEIEDCVILGSAMDGRKTIELVRRKNPDLLITDIDMPFANGIEIYEHICRERLPTLVLALSNYDSYNLVRPMLKMGAIDYILKNELDATLLNKKIREVHSILSRREIKQSQIKYYSLVAKKKLLSDLITQHTLDNDLDILKTEPEFQDGCHLVVCIQTTSLSDANGEHGDKFIQNIENLCNSTVATMRKGIITYLRNGMFAGLMDADESLGYKKIKEEAYNLMLLLQSNLERILNIRILFSIKIFNGSIYNISTIFSDAINEINRDHFGKSVCESPIRSAQNMVNISYERALVNALYQVDKDTVKKVVSNVFNEAVRFGISGILSAVTEFNDIGARFIKQYCRVINNSTQCTVPEIKGINDVSLIADYFTDYFYEIMKSACTQDQDVTLSDYILKALEYIHIHYAEDISLSTISNDIHISPIYFSRIFKEQTGNTFIEYLTHYRISMAKEMLLNSSIT